MGYTFFRSNLNGIAAPSVSTDRQVDLSQRVIGLPLRNAPGAAGWPLQ
jgi:hypothetical protein